MTEKQHPSGSPLCATCKHTRLLHFDPITGKPYEICSDARCKCRKFVPMFAKGGEFCTDKPTLLLGANG